ncbi:MAG: NAD(P)-dependent oxidoreductase, partial [Armatimonadota bacterium]
TKVIGEDLALYLHERTGIPVALLRYHDFVPKPYLAFGAKLLRNGVDAEDVASATLRSVEAGLDKRFGCFRTIVHTAHGLPEAVRSDFAALGPAWCESMVSGSAALLERFAIELPREVEQHDLGEAERILGWKPSVGFTTFLEDLGRRVERGEPVDTLWAPGSLTGVGALA